MNKQSFDEVKEPILQEKKNDDFCIWFIDLFSCCCCCLYNYDLS
jgi:hypothetical protein